METVNNNPAIAKVPTLSLVKPLFVFIMPLGLELVTFGWKSGGTGGLGDWETGRIVFPFHLSPFFFPLSPSQLNSISTGRDRLKRR